MHAGLAKLGIGARLRSIASLLGESAHSRLALLAAEVDELLSGALRALVASLAALTFTALAIIALLAALAIGLPEAARAPTIALIAVLLAAIAATLFAWTARLLRIRAFSASLDELRKDLDHLRSSAAAQSTERCSPVSSSTPYDPIR